MQQTENYKLNLIETSDPFSPQALNENAEKVEAAIIAGDAALDARVTVLEAHKIVAGTYIGTGEVIAAQGVQLGFTPALVVIKRAGISVSVSQFIAVSGMTVTDAQGQILEIVPGGFKPGKTLNNSCNNVNETYYYFAIG